MNKKQAINMMGELVVIHKKEIVDVCNEQKLGSLKYSSDIEDVNEIVIDNITNRDFLTSIDNIVFEKNEYLYEPISITVWMIATVIAVASSVTISNTVRNNIRAREEIYRQGYTKRYLDKETLGEVAFLNRKEMQKQFLIAQQDYLQQEENMIQQNRLDTRRNIVIILVGGILTIMIASKLLNR